jgi:hypothetical protein
MIWINKIISVIIFIIIFDVCLSLFRNYRRTNIFNKATKCSKQKQKQLLVIGSPFSGWWNKNIQQAYGCGNICLDLVGCNKCPKSIKGDILIQLKKMKTNKYVIFESCVLEYVDLTQLDDINKEIKRVSGNDYFEVRIKPNIFSTQFSFIECG